MPYLTIVVADLEASGPVLDVQLGNSQTGQQALQQQHQAVPGPLPIRALVDTGADMCVIEDGLARQLNLTLIGFQLLAGGLTGSTASGTTPVPEYSASLLLPNGIPFDITAIEISLPSGLQMLIGRDVLAKGSFLYEGLNDRFTLTF